MKYLSLGRKASDWITSLYIVASLYLRFVLEPQLQGHYLLSIGLGAFALLFLWALVKSKVLNPSFFGMYDRQEAAAE